MLALGIAVMSLAGAPGAAAHPFLVDQENIGNPGGGVLIHSIQLGAPIGQSFTPLLPALDVVELLTIDFGDFPNGIGATLQVNLRADSIAGNIIATSNPVALPDDFGGPTVTFPNGGGVTHFDFAATVALVPGNLYVIEPVVVAGDSWGLVDILGVYANGSAIVSGHETPGDWWFREGPVAIPVPATLALFGVGLLAMALRRSDDWGTRRLEPVAGPSVLPGDDQQRQIPIP
ncbi:MAG TPA: PEP-CTERM sorting domain-containing protein [Methylomirabilota bacterium]|nr:PEP-CTERM sorting domain-containing protein [Methylomirabilota bacterium]